MNCLQKSKLKICFFVIKFKFLYVSIKNYNQTINVIILINLLFINNFEYVYKIAKSSNSNIIVVTYIQILQTIKFYFCHDKYINFEKSKK